jgi:cytochrome c oxidase subunit 3
MPPDTYRLGMLFALAGIAMLFISLTSAYVVRQGLGTDWQRLRMPELLWVNTAVLLASSVTLEIARGNLSRRWLVLTLALGCVFLGGQLAAWRQLAAEGFFLGTNPHSSFFYTLTGLHGLHVAGGLVALGWAALRMRRRWVEVTALYWHFMDGLWLYLLVLLFWRG